MIAGLTALDAAKDGATPTDMIFPVRTVVAHKKPNGGNAEATITATAIRPGP